ncbi:MAG: formate dehydrogenase accessory sulfurtransferase FdhD [Bacteroidia bacterium]|nr:formate dehydrogenase accessory sulfurtransferase FdhD [Bacteroidia bacterium]
MAKSAVYPIKIIKVNESNFEQANDLIAVEEPLEIRIGYGNKDNRNQKNISVTMRTPGHDFELALGFLFTEGIIENVGQISQIKYCTALNSQKDEENIVRVELHENVTMDFSKIQRNFYTTSSCGVCGKASIDAIKTVCNSTIIQPEFLVQDTVILSLPQKLRALQNVFEHTGGIHACALFESNGNIVLSREDVGRHNALDKLIGAVVGSKNQEISFNNKILLLSGRASFELIQKAAMAQIKVVCAVGAPSSLAVQTAIEFGITLIGFLRDNRFNIYTGAQRIQMKS